MCSPSLPFTVPSIVDILSCYDFFTVDKLILIHFYELDSILCFMAHIVFYKAMDFDKSRCHVLHLSFLSASGMKRLQELELLVCLPIGLGSDKVVCFESW